MIPWVLSSPFNKSVLVAAAPISSAPTVSFAAVAESGGEGWLRRLWFCDLVAPQSHPFFQKNATVFGRQLEGDSWHRLPFKRGEAMTEAKKKKT
jgi:hypothetical protein